MFGKYLCLLTSNFITTGCDSNEFLFDRSETDRYCPACLDECDRDELGEDNLLNREKVIVN